MLAVDSVAVQKIRALRPLTHPAIVAFGLANLYLLDLTGPVISTDHDLIYHLIGSASSVIVPIIVYVLALPSILLHTIANFSGTEIPDWITNLVAALCLLTLLVISFGWKKFLR